jgi:hypothetical protein
MISYHMIIKSSLLIVLPLSWCQDRILWSAWPGVMESSKSHSILKKKIMKFFQVSSFLCIKFVQESWSFLTIYWFVLDVIFFCLTDLFTLAMIIWCQECQTSDVISLNAFKSLR